MVLKGSWRSQIFSDVFGCYDSFLGVLMGLSNFERFLTVQKRHLTFLGDLSHCIGFWEVPWSSEALSDFLACFVLFRYVFIGSEQFWKTLVRFESFYEVLKMLWCILRHLLVFEWFWNINECFEGLFEVLRCSDVIRGVIFGSEFFLKHSRKFLRHSQPYMFWAVHKGSWVFWNVLDIQEVFWCILRRSEAFSWVLNCSERFLKVLRHSLM